MKHLVLIMVLTGIGYLSNACDICGCGVGSSYTGILPEFKRNMVGIRHRYNVIRTHIGPGGTATYLTTNEYYNTVELWAGLRINNRLRVLLTIPYQFNRKVNNSNTYTKNGMGDATAIGYYRLLNTIQGNGKKSVTQILWTGAGIKLPTGKYNSQDKSISAGNNLFQLGTGSIDAILSLMYDINYHGWGMNVNANYKINTNNQYDYTYGNKTSLSSQLYYRWNAGKNLVISPNTGVQLERSASDTDQNETVDISGGTITMGGLGIEAVFKKYALGVNWQTPLQQDMANGVIKGKQRTMLHFSILF